MDCVEVWVTGGTGQRWTVWRYGSQEEQGKGGLCGTVWRYRVTGETGQRWTVWRYG